MDENEVTTQDPLPEKGQASGVENSNPSQTAKTFTEEEHNKILSERHSTLDKQVASLGKEKESLQANQTALEQKVYNLEQTMAEVERLKEEAEFSRIQGDPTALGQYQREKRLKELAAEVAKEKAEIAKVKADVAKERDALEADKAELSQFKRSKLIAKVAAKFELDPKKLDKPYLETEEAIMDFAKTLTGKTPEDTPEVRLDRPSGSGATRTPSTPGELIAEGLRRERKK